MARGFSAAILYLLAIACRSPRPPVTASIEFTTIPRADAGGPATLEPIAGRVTGARTNQRIVVYAMSGGVWWVQPFRSRPFTEISSDSTWKNSIHLGTEYAALLVEADYRPPATTESLPQRGGSVTAVVRVTGSGTFVPPARKTLAFSGYEWEVRQQRSDRHGANDYDARNAWVDDQGHLHLVLTERDGRWTCAEVQMTRSLGYGTYSFDVRDTSRLDAAAAFSMYTWDVLAADQNYRELTIEVGHWGDRDNVKGKYIVQPETVAANVFRFAIPGALATHSFRWEPGRVSFKTVQRSSARRGEVVVAERLFTARVPAAGNENPHLTLAYYRAAATPPSNDVEVVIEKFTFIP
jgi:hypothetical protein